MFGYCSSPGNRGGVFVDNSGSPEVPNLLGRCSAASGADGSDAAQPEVGTGTERAGKNCWKVSQRGIDPMTIGNSRTRDVAGPFGVTVN